MAQSYYTPFVVASAQVPSAQSNFPALVYASDARFKTIGNGGHVVSGTDIRPYSDTGLSSALTYEMEFYDGTNGIWIGWVLLSTADTSVTIYLGYGDAALNTDGSSSSTWPSQYKGVYHLPNGSSLSVLDSTSNANHGTNNNGVTAVSGKIDGAASFVASSLQTITTANIISAPHCTVSAWAKVASWPGARSSVVGVLDGITQASDKNLLINSDGTMSFFVYDGNSKFATSSGTISTNTFTYLVGTADGSNSRLYIGGSQDGSTACGNTSAAFPHPGFQFNGLLAGGAFQDIVIDEARIADTEASADWITTEYNNQSAPNTFWTMGSEVAVGGGGSIVPILNHSYRQRRAA